MLQIEWSKTVRAIRLSSATLVTFFITWYFEVPEGIWALITCGMIILEYTTFGGFLNKAFLRFLGTALNSIAALIIVYSFGNNSVVNLIALVIGIFINAYVFLDTTKSYTSILGCITLMITLVNYHDLSAPILRTFNVLLGEGVCFLTFYCIFPEYARDKVINTQIRSFSGIINLLKQLLNPELPLDEVKNHYQLYEKEFLAGVIEFNRYISETPMEVKNAPMVVDEHKKAMSSLKHIYYLLNTSFYYMAREDRFEASFISTTQKMIQDLEFMQQLLKHPTEKKISLISLTDAAISAHVPPTLQIIFQDIDHEFQALANACQKISAIRLHHYRKTLDTHV